MKKPQFTIRLNQDVSGIKCEKNGQEYLSDFKQGQEFICECDIIDVRTNQQYTATTNEWSKIYFPAAVCDELLVKIPIQF